MGTVGLDRKSRTSQPAVALTERKDRHQGRQSDPCVIETCEVRSDPPLLCLDQPRGSRTSVSTARDDKQRTGHLGYSLSSRPNVRMGSGNPVLLFRKELAPAARTPSSRHAPTGPTMLSGTAARSVPHGGRARLIRQGSREAPSGS